VSLKVMTSQEENSGRFTLKLAGVLQEVRDLWVRRLDTYYNQLESLVDGQWLNEDDIRGILRESRMASREALDGLGNDLSSELLHVSNGIVARYEAERASLMQEINDLRESLGRALSGDERSIRRENETLHSAIAQVPEYELLQVVEASGRTTYDQLSEDSGRPKRAVRKLVKRLCSLGHVRIDKKARPHQVVYLSAPWLDRTDSAQDTLEPVRSSPALVPPVERP
jgi:hypothetical protein